MLAVFWMCVAQASGTILILYTLLSKTVYCLRRFKGSEFNRDQGAAKPAIHMDMECSPVMHNAASYKL
jgi:hypothetical protein